MIDKQLLQKRFSANAKTYDQFANVQKKMADCLLTQVVMKRSGSSPFHILEIGCGTGYLTEKLSRHFQNATITAIDLAPGMIEIAKQRISSERIRFICGDIEEMELYDKYDVIISNATFQWLNHLEHTLSRLSSRLKREGMMLFSTFGSGTFHELHSSFQKAMQKLQHDTNARLGQPFYSLEDLVELCERSVQPVHPTAAIFGTETIETERFHSVKDFFTSLRKIGATNSAQGPYYQRPSVFKEMMNIYEKEFQENGHIIATYHCLFVGIEC
ncbi:malonyl-CoA O-methyltransferase [Anoxybacillus vitaminiphilus]|uniref:Malonyl-[acyl-carrier protein] O-methyltransferase n=1 Tax=Paranoxybacillus vitaminiphilus TaxID=581036 RepID=A0A327Y0G2_9BACL|nr:malonyl-ACP O-methyltransferase BioC [Anoxybacillus vitaminiphilus]RAK14274.1 malonyl-CoA O-methyltransferase [Anoxybacillus vitaminiphilus]